MDKLPVPENISLRNEFWRGFGAKEAVLSCVVCSIVLAVMVAFCIIHKGENDVLIFTVVMVFSIAFSVSFFGKVPSSNQSVFEFLKRQAAYKKEQQQFPYIRRKEVYQLVQDEAKI